MNILAIKLDSCSRMWFNWLFFQHILANFTICNVIKVPFICHVAFLHFLHFQLFIHCFFKRPSSNCSSVLGYDKMQCKAKTLHAAFPLIKDAGTCAWAVVTWWTAVLSDALCNYTPCLFITSYHGFLYVLRDHFCSLIFLLVASKLHFKYVCPSKENMRKVPTDPC